MLEELTQRILDVKQDLRRKKDLQRSLAGARSSLQRQRQTLERLKTELTEERADVEALEEISLRTLFHTILGDKEEQVEKERQEVLAAKLRYDEAREAVAALEADVAELEQMVERLGNVEARYGELLEWKEKLLSQSGRPEAENLVQLSEAQADAESDLRELREAVRAGNGVLHSLDRAISALRTAETWGTFDLLGGGVLATAAKHGRVDEARHWTHRAQQGLRRFRRELADLESDVTVGIHIGGFETFADYFFDGLIADWVVQSSIRSSLDRAREMRRRVHTTVTALRRKVRQVQQRAAQIKEERKAIIERAC